MNLDLEELLADLAIPDSLELFRPHWGESEACLPDGLPPILDPAEIERNCTFVRLPSEVESVLQQTARRVRERPALLHLAWHCYRLLFYHREYEASRIAQWPELGEALGELAGLFYMVVALGVVPLTRAIHQSHGVPGTITRDTVSRFEELMNSYRNGTGKRWGVPVRVLYWLRHYTAGDLYLLGRMEYMVKPFYGPVQVYRNCQTDEVLALATDGTRFNADGLIDASPAPETDGGWTARLVVEENRVIGWPVSPEGFGIRAEVVLPLRTWRQVLAPGDPVLDTHIPAGGGMTPEACADTHRQALEFFPRYFPDRPFVGFACYSWILNPELEWIYSPTSNMVLWQRELYLFPIPSGRKSGIYFIFGKDEVDPATASRDTSLKRAFLDHLAIGGRLVGGGMFLLTEDFKHFGSQYYRSQWPPSAMAGVNG